MPSSLCQISRVSTSLPGFLTFFITFHICKVESALFTVVGPDQPITAIVGEEIVLPCRLSPSMSAANMEVRWFRPGSTNDVHLYRDGRDQFGGQMPEYERRTEFWKDGITDGNVSLRILNIGPSDEGLYICLVEDDITYKEAVIELKVAALGSNPIISVEDYQKGGIRVTCQSAEWYPEPQVLWRNGQGHHIASLSEIKSPKVNGLFETEISVVINRHSNQNLSCWIRNSLLDREKESAIHISALFFPSMNPWVVVLSMILVVLLSFTILNVYLFKIKGNLQRELGWKRAVICPGLGQTAPTLEKEDVIVDPDTAYHYLILSEDGKNVRWTDTPLDLPDNPERFDTERCVLGREGFTSGRHWWEVEVGEGMYWAVGVARESVRRKGQISFSPEEGVCAVLRYWGEYEALTAHRRTPLPLHQVPSRVGVYLDCTLGQVSFLDADTGAPIFTCPPASFVGDRIRPCFWVQFGEINLRHHP
ncbi:butyrophilin subfamily 1 member A1 isoform X1 [Alligator mississippiensis]|uniref:butyrophilin subfamily 1 member A1 isoform X1 n=1 Tax=Alligator mississippiensis TaxID=8496 RepID=UPI0028772AEC|nr:butyrophilin subfamily 1 member A1 isoform X1 [Alligator mississippiensis]XP_059570997.1 butyrophilin subfamily 1 member A1 isoform X1 [Alligator mississippiensis]